MEEHIFDRINEDQCRRREMCGEKDEPTGGLIISEINLYTCPCS
jgi:hypothetical protein